MSDAVDWLNVLANWAIAGSVAGLGFAALRLLRAQSEKSDAFFHAQSGLIEQQNALLRKQLEAAEKQAELLQKQIEITQPQAALLQKQIEIAEPQAALLKSQAADERNDIKLELFTQRYQIYLRMVQFCELVRKRDGKLSRQDAADFALSINHAQFLFDTPAWEYVASMRDKGVRLNELYESIYEIHKDAAGVEYLAAKPLTDQTLNKEFSNLIDWFTTQPPHIKEQVMPYLDFTRFHG